VRILNATTPNAKRHSRKIKAFGFGHDTSPKRLLPSKSLIRSIQQDLKVRTTRGQTWDGARARAKPRSKNKKAQAKPREQSSNGEQYTTVVHEKKNGSVVWTILLLDHGTNETDHHVDFDINTVHESDNGSCIRHGERQTFWRFD
jgi:hypothetical protein